MTNHSNIEEKKKKTKKRRRIYKNSIRKKNDNDINSTDMIIPLDNRQIKIMMERKEEKK